jgi:hypothetical protein
VDAIPPRAPSRSCLTCAHERPNTEQGVSALLRGKRYEIHCAKSQCFSFNCRDLATHFGNGCTGSVACDGLPDLHGRRCIFRHRGNRSRCECALVRVESRPSFGEAWKIASGPCRNYCVGWPQSICRADRHDGKALPRVDNEASVPRLLKAGVIVAQKDFDQVAAYLQKRGVEAGIFEDKEMGVRSFLFKDNDGNLIQFFTHNR